LRNTNLQEKFVAVTAISAQASLTNESCNTLEIHTRMESRLHARGKISTSSKNPSHPKLPIMILLQLKTNQTYLFNCNNTRIKLFSPRQINGARCVKSITKKGALLLSIGLIMSIISPSYSQVTQDMIDLCPVQSSKYLQARRARDFYTQQFNANSTCSRASAMLASWRNEINMGRDIDACLCSYGACIRPDSEVIRSYNNFARHINAKCGWR
jgi:hypothetical protein